MVIPAPQKFWRAQTSFIASKVRITTIRKTNIAVKIWLFALSNTHLSNKIIPTTKITDRIEGNNNPYAPKDPDIKGLHSFTWRISIP